MALTRKSQTIALLVTLGYAVSAHVDPRPAPPWPMGTELAEWPTADGVRGTHYSPLADIRPSNVRALEVAWSYRTGDVDDGSAGTAGSAFEATPIMVDGMLFLSTPFSRVVALDAETGRELWTFDPGVNRSADIHGMTTSRGVSTWLDPERSERQPCRRWIFLASFDARLFALDATSGRLCQDFGRDGRVDLRAGVERIQGSEDDYRQTAPPAMIGDLVVVGSSIIDGRSADSPSGVVRAFDARTGRLRWSFDPLPGVGGVDEDGTFVPAGAANTWATITTDEERDLVFVPTGSPSPDHWGGLRSGDNLYANSLVALRGSTGEVVWHFQMVRHDLSDYDLPAPPALIDLTHEGRKRAAVAVGTKMGFIFILDRDTGESLFPIEDRAVPVSDVPGELTAPTQPVPLLPPPLVPQRLDPDDAWGLTPFDRGACRDRIAQFRSEGIYTPPSVRGSIVYPGFIGGMEWGGLAFDPGSGLLVTNTNRVATVATLIPADEIQSTGADAGKKSTTSFQSPAPYGVRREALLSPLGIPCNPPPWGMLHAVDSDTGALRWEVPLGDVRDISIVPPPWAWGSANLGGPLITGGLVFIAATMDRQIRAFDLSSGEQAWQATLPASAQAAPMTYRVRPGGRQYVVIAAAGGHHGMGSRLGDHVVAFALPEPGGGS